MRSPSGGERDASSYNLQGKRVGGFDKAESLGKGERAALAAWRGGETFLQKGFPAPKCILPASRTSYLLPIISWVLKVRRSSC